MKYEDIQNKGEDGPEESVYVEQILERESKTRSGEHEFVPDRTFNTKISLLMDQRLSRENI